jgi:hypothetical protein
MMDMKTFFSILSALVLVTLFGCTNDEIVGNNTSVNPKDAGAIAFSGGSSMITRTTSYGATAAAKLGKTFVVYGTKHVTAEDKTATNDAVVFNNFQIKWTSASAGSNESNASDWGYLGLQSYDATPTSQGIKYWDYSAAQGHTFYAFSSSDISYPKNEANDKVLVSKTTSDETSLYNKGYAVTIKNGASLNNLYFSDRVPVAKADYDKTVNFTFRNVATLLRVGFYETIPGYKVQIDKFYIDDDATAAVTSFAAMKDAKTDGFYASLQNVKGSTDQTVNVTYYDNSDPTIENRAKLTNPTGGYNYALKLGSGASIIGTDLGISASSPTWVNSEYTSVFPFEDNTNPLLLKLDFTMYAEDGSPDVIHVRGARAVVPAQYIKWKSNFAYTYIFKISDKTNGTTGNVDANDDPTDPEGLMPITFDAIVYDVTEEQQQTISSVSSNSITTYAEGAIVNEYTATKPIYVVASNSTTGAVITPTGLGDTDGKAQVYKLSKAATEAEVFAQLTGSPIGLTMEAETATLETTIPLADGSTPAISNVKFTPATAGTYAYVYTTTKYVAPTYVNQSAGTYDSSKTYYMKTANNVYYAVTVANAAAFNEHKAQLYIIDSTAPGTPGKYDVKVIKVQ